MDLQNIEVKLDDEDLAIYLLCSLPPSYKNFRETLLYGRENLSSDDVKNSLKQRDRIDTQLSPKSQGGSSDGLFVRGRTLDKGSTSGGGNKGKGRLKSRGLLATISILKATSRRIVGNEKTKNASDDGAKDATIIADASYVNDSDDGGVLVATHGYNDGDEWILVSRCTFHMTPNKTFFQTYESVDGRNVTIGNNTTCKVVGVGSVKMRMIDGMMRTL